SGEHASLKHDVAVLGRVRQSMRKPVFSTLPELLQFKGFVEATHLLEPGLSVLRPRTRQADLNLEMETDWRIILRHALRDPLLILFYLQALVCDFHRLDSHFTTCCFQRSAFQLGRKCILHTPRHYGRVVFVKQADGDITTGNGIHLDGIEPFVILIVRLHDASLERYVPEFLKPRHLGNRELGRRSVAVLYDLVLDVETGDFRETDVGASPVYQEMKSRKWVTHMSKFLVIN